MSARLAYLTSLYPAASHTFILREVAGLRALGLTVDTCSVRRPAAQHLIGAPERAAEASTFYVIEAGRRPATMLAALGAALGRPGALLKTLGLAWRTAPPGLRGGLKQIAYLAEAMVLSRHLRANGTTHLHNHFADVSANVAMLTSALSDIPFSYTLHGPAELYEPRSWALAEKTHRARFVACISHFARSQAMYFSDPADWDRLHIIHCGVQPGLYAPDADRDDTDGAVEAVFVGRLTAIKGLRVLLDALRAARAQNPQLRLTIIGDGEDRAELQAMAADMGDAVRFTGYLSQAEIAAALKRADMMVLPSFAEGLPVVLMESLAAECPVIASRVAGVAELVEDGVSGFLVHAGDTEQLTERMLKLAGDRDLRRRMGRAGRARVQVDFDAEVEAARLASLFLRPDGAPIRPAPINAGDV